MDYQLIDFLWIPVITLLAYTPIVCYLDWKYREIDHILWMWLGAINGIVAAGMLIGGIYEWWFYIPSAVACLIFLGARVLDYIQGADLIYLSMIAIFFQYNPISGHWFPVLAFCIYLAATMIITGICIIWYKIIPEWATGKFTCRDKSDTSLFMVPGGIPMMLPISAALILTVVMG